MAVWIDLPVEEIVVRYEAGESTPELGRAYGVHTTTIWKRLRAAGVEMRPISETSKHARKWRKLGGPLSDNGKGYLRTRDRNSKQVRLHRGCWEAYNGPIPDGHVVHHVNGNTLDNRIENLACMMNSEHAQLPKCVI